MHAQWEVVKHEFSSAGVYKLSLDERLYQALEFSANRALEVAKLNDRDRSLSVPLYDSARQGHQCTGIVEPNQSDGL